VYYEYCPVKEGLTFQYKTYNNCEDDPTWSVTDKKGSKHKCSGIGTTASCYDFDDIGRDGWESCLKTCGICDNSLVSKKPMNMLATFSGDLIEDYGIVLNMDSDRAWVGSDNNRKSTVSDDGTKTDISNMRQRLDSVEDIFDIISGNVIQCNQDPDQSGNNVDENFYGCKNQLINCPSVSMPSGARSYIRSADGKVEFPAVSISCADIGVEPIPAPLSASIVSAQREELLARIQNDGVRAALDRSGGLLDAVAEMEAARWQQAQPNPIPSAGIIPSECNNYILFDRVIDEGNDSKVKKLTIDRNIVSLYDTCPHQCNPEICKSDDDV